MKKAITKVMALALVFSMAFGFMAPMQAEAAKVKKIKAVFGENKAPAVKKGKQYLITSKEYDYDKGLTYVKFTSPKTKNYTIKLSDLAPAGKSSNSEIMNGCLAIYAYDAYDYLNRVPIYYDGEEASTLWMCSNYSWVLKDNDNPDPVKDYLPERTVKLKIPKGTTIWFGFNFIDKCDIKLKIK